MNKFKNGAASFGITPQSIFRIADFSYKNEVEADYFRQVLAKIDLGLTQMEISCLIYIFDENQQLWSEILILCQCLSDSDPNSNKCDVIIMPVWF